MLKTTRNLAEKLFKNLFSYNYIYISNRISFFGKSYWIHHCDENHIFIPYFKSYYKKIDYLYLNSFIARNEIQSIYYSADRDNYGRLFNTDNVYVSIILHNGDFNYFKLSFLDFSIYLKKYLLLRKRLFLCLSLL